MVRLPSKGPDVRSSLGILLYEAFSNAVGRVLTCDVCLVEIGQLAQSDNANGTYSVSMLVCSYVGILRSEDQ